jgi:hypothetical protein
MSPLLSIVILALSLTSFSRGDSSCDQVFKNENISPKFPLHVYHILHAVTLNDLKKFEPSTTENNRVPTIDHDRIAKQRILYHTPDVKTGDEMSFKTDMMRVLDLTLSAMDNKQYYENDYSVLEQVVHRAHLHEFFETVLEEYNKLKKTTGPTAGLCQCVMDVENNGVMALLRIAAAKSTFVQSEGVCENTLRYSILDGHIRYKGCSENKRRKRGIVGGFSDCAGISEHDAATLRSIPDDSERCQTNPTDFKLTGSSAWSMYKKRFQCLEGTASDAASFLYCALKQV